MKEPAFELDLGWARIHFDGRSIVITNPVTAAPLKLEQSEKSAGHWFKLTQK